MASEQLLQSVSLPPLEVIFGSTPIMRKVREKLAILADAPVPVLILGESGTGKDVLARLLHTTSDLRDDAFVKLSCPAIPGSLLETELFGYEKGAFTGANAVKRGRIENAHNGTLFLDEIGDLDLALQAKLLQLLQDGTYCRVGGHEERRVNVRLISATNRDLQKQVELGRFRGDLFYRINALTIELPALRDRINDLPVLIDYFLSVYSAKFNRAVPPLSDETTTLLKHHHWPGNIRELENLIRRYVIFGSEDSIVGELMLPEETNTITAEITIDTTVPLKEITKRAVVDLEREIILRVLKANDWNRKRTAESLQISYRSLIYKMRDAGFPLIRTRSTVTTDPAISPQFQTADC